jgi:protein gp37
MTKKTKKKFNEANESIDWAKWSWNPVTGCKHACEYCYATPLTKLYPKAHPYGMKPHFHADRLDAPFNTKIPRGRENEPGIRNVFVTSMGDLFGEWVEQEWIDRVLDVVRRADMWNFMFLTKNPKRLAEIDWPTNSWIGTTVDRQHRVDTAVEIFSRLDAPVKYLSCEPMLEELTFPKMDCFDMIIIGAQTGAGGRQPKLQWVESLVDQARSGDCQIYTKPNLKVGPVILEYPPIRPVAATGEELTEKSAASRTNAQRGVITYGEMSAALRQACDDIHEALSSSVETEVTARHKVGEIVRRVMGNEDKYGRKSVPRLGRVLGLDPSGLYDAAKVATCWSEDEVRGLLGRQDRDKKKNVGISWSHMVALARIEDKKDRERALRETIGYGWSIRDLQKEIAKAGASGGGGAKSAPDVMSDLRRFEKTSEASENKLPSWDELFVDAMDDPSDEVATPEALKILRAIQTTQQEIKARCEKNLEQTEAAISKIEEKIAAKDEEDGEQKVEAA